MGYYIVYGPQKLVKNGNFRRGLLTAGAFGVFCLLVLAFWPEGREMFADILLPGDRETAAEAAEEMVRALRQGQSLGEAVTAFCRDVIRYD